jgi:hypothetical protein
MYDTRTVAFLDILGFKDVIRRSESNLFILMQVRQALTDLSASSKFDSGSNSAAQMCLQCFSDNVVICGTTSWVFHRIITIGQAMIKLGFPIRGGVTQGKIFFSNGVIFGPSLVRAVEMESSLAVVPRILVDAIPGVQNEFSSLLLEDIDGKLFIDVLKSYDGSSPARILDYEQCLCQLRALITQSLVRFRGNSEILLKYEWLMGYFNTTIERYGICGLEQIQPTNDDKRP